MSMNYVLREDGVSAWFSMVGHNTRPLETCDLQNAKALVEALHKEIERLEEAAKYGPCKFSDLKRGDFFCRPCSGPRIYSSDGRSVSLVDGRVRNLHRDTPVTRLRKSEVKL